MRAFFIFSSAPVETTFTPASLRNERGELVPIPTYYVWFGVWAWSHKWQEELQKIPDKNKWQNVDIPRTDAVQCAAKKMKRYSRDGYQFCVKKQQVSVEDTVYLIIFPKTRRKALAHRNFETLHISNNYF